MMLSNRLSKIIEGDQGADLVSMENPTATLEDLFLGIVRDSKARPGYNRKRERDQDSEPEVQEASAQSADQS